MVEGENQNELPLYKKTQYVILKKETLFLNWVEYILIIPKGMPFVRKFDD